jgi:hypothetical protein
MRVFLSTLVALVVISLFLASTVESNKSQPPIINKANWWDTQEPDVTIGNMEYYAKNCSILQVNALPNTNSAKTIFTVPSSVFSSCDNVFPALIYEDGYLVFQTCQIVFGAGGCGRSRYRSSDMKAWQEDIGITWIEGEEYEAWRNLGSTSSNADSVKRIKNDK